MQGDEGAHRVAHDDARFDPQVVQGSYHVPSMSREPVAPPGRLVGVSSAPEIQGDDAVRMAEVTRRRVERPVLGSDTM